MVRGDRGSASLICLGVGLVFLAIVAGALAVGRVVVARHRAQNAADSAALAGALTAVRGRGPACAAAGRLAAANGGRLVRCEVGGPIVTVAVEVRAGAGRVVEASARAGPVQSIPADPRDELAEAEAEAAANPKGQGGSGPWVVPPTGPRVGPREGPDRRPGEDG